MIKKIIKSLWLFPTLTIMAALILLFYPFVRLITAIENYRDSREKNNV